MTFPKKCCTVKYKLKKVSYTMNIDTRTLINVEVEGVDMNDYPDFCDAYIAYAEKPSGFALTDAELDVVNEDYDFVYEEIQNFIY